MKPRTIKQSSKIYPSKFASKFVGRGSRIDCFHQYADAAYVHGGENDSPAVDCGC